MNPVFLNRNISLPGIYKNSDKVIIFTAAAFPLLNLYLFLFSQKTVTVNWKQSMFVTQDDS